MTSPVTDPALDHLVYGVPDLLDGVRRVHELTGVQATPGGRHLQQGTANYLLGLGDGGYLEIIGPDPEASQPPTWFGLADLRAPRLLTWAVRPADLDASVATARAAGYDPGSPVDMSRATGSGGTLRWRLTPDSVASTGGVIPFLIAWGDSPHPSRTALPRVELRTLSVLTATPDQTRAQLAALAVESLVAVEPASVTGLRGVLLTDNGAVTLD